MGSILSFALLAGGACGDDDDAGDVARLCDSAARKLRECGLLGEGAVNCAFEEGDRAAAECQDDCVQAADCATLSDLVCSADPTVSADVLALNGCINECWNEFGFQCESPGPARAVDPSFVCDGEADCADGSDEIACEMFACGDGQEVVLLAFCDGFDDCDNGADEGAGCEQFSCSDGASVPQSFRCDMVADCADGSDEADCGSLATVQCGP